MLHRIGVKKLIIMDAFQRPKTPFVPTTNSQSNNEQNHNLLKKGSNFTHASFERRVSHYVEKRKITVGSECNNSALYFMFACLNVTLKHSFQKIQGFFHQPRVLVRFNMNFFDHTHTRQLINRLFSRLIPQYQRCLVSHRMDQSQLTPIVPRELSDNQQILLERP